LLNLFFGIAASLIIKKPILGQSYRLNAISRFHKRMQRANHHDKQSSFGFEQVSKMEKFNPA